MAGEGEGEFLVEEVRPDGSLVVLGREPLRRVRAQRPANGQSPEDIEDREADE